MIFELIFGLLSAWNVAGLIIMSGVFLLIGGVILGDFLLWQFYSRRVSARIEALRVVFPRETSTKSLAEKNTEVSESFKESFRKQPVATMLASLVLFLFLLFPLAFTGMGVWMGYKYFSLTQYGIYSQGVVVDNEETKDSDGAVSYKAVVTFVDKSGLVHRVKDSFSYGGSPSFKQGSTVGIYFDASDPQRFVIDDFWHNMTISIVFSLIGFVFVGLIAVARLGKNSKDDAHKPTNRFWKRKKYAGETYYPVYQYTAACGVFAQHIATLPLSLFLNHMPGRKVSLLVMDGDKPQIRTSHWLSLILGGIFFAPGLFIGSVALSQMEDKPLFYLILFSLFAYCVFRFLRFYYTFPLEKREEAWHMVRSGKLFKEIKITSSDASIFSGEQGSVLSRSDLILRIPTQKKLALRGAVIMFVLCAALSVGAYYAGIDMMDRYEKGIRARAEVVDFKEHYSSDDGGGYTYSAVVEYFDQGGDKVRFDDSVRASSPLYKKGEYIIVLYNPLNSKDAIIDRGVWNWTLSLGLSIFAILFFWGTLHSFALFLAGGARSVA